MTPLQCDLDVTIVAPVRDEEANISRFVESLLCQSLAPREIVIADGGSLDRTKKIIREFIGAGHPIRLIEDRNALPGRGRNLAIDAAVTEWVALIDCGTVPGADWLRKLVERTAGGSVDAVFGSYEPALDSLFRESLALAFVDPGTVIDGVTSRGPTTASMMIRKAAWERLGRFPEHLRACEDLVFFRRLAESDLVVEHAADATVDWTIPGDAASTFRRFRRYSLETLKAGLGNIWHRAVARMYVVGFLALILALAHHWAWMLILPVGLGLRTCKSVMVRKRSLKLSRRINPHTYLIVAVLLLIIDVAAFVGAIDYLVERISPSPDVRERQAESSLN